MRERKPDGEGQAEGKVVLECSISSYRGVDHCRGRAAGYIN